MAVLLSLVLVATGGFDFKTPGEAAYCRMEFGRKQLAAFRCITPNDGFWVRISGGLFYSGSGVRVTKGFDSRFKGYRDSRVQVIPFGRTWATSDAEVITCRSRRNGLTCRHPMSGWAFWLGRYRGYRIYRTKRGFPIRARPLFRTSYAWCGLNRETLEPANPALMCWHPGSGMLAGLAHDDAGRGASVSPYAWARDYRPRGYPLLRTGARFVWRCRGVSRRFASFGCSTRRGLPVFTCEVSTRVRCVNRRNRGFVLGPRGRTRTF